MCGYLLALLGLLVFFSISWKLSLLTSTDMIILRVISCRFFAKSVDRALALLFTLVLGVSVFGCELGFAEPRGQSPKADQKSSLTVLATTTLVAELCRIVGGNQVNVDSLMNPNANPHTFRPDFVDVRRLRGANIVVSIGLGFEAQIAETLNSRAQTKPVIVLANSLPPSVSMASEGGGVDAHFWGDVSLWARAAEYLAAELGNLDYGNRQAYMLRGEEYRRTLMALHQEMSEKLREVRPHRRVLTTSHRAFRYLGSAYGWENIGFFGGSLPVDIDEAEKKREARALLGKMQKRGTSIFFGEATAPTDLTNTLNESARKQGLTIVSGGTLSIDTLGEHDSETGSYEKMMRCNLETILRAAAMKD